MHPVFCFLTVTVLCLSGCFGRVARYADEFPSAAERGLETFNPDRGPVSSERVLAFILTTNPYLRAEEARALADAMQLQAEKHRIPLHLLVSLIATESSFNVRAVSPVGAQGLGQLMPATARDMGISDPFDPQQNIFATARYLAWLDGRWRAHPRRWELILASYLAGIGTVTRQMQAGRDLTGEQYKYVGKIFRLAGRV